MVGGEAVYWARAILKIDVDDSYALLSQYRIGSKEDLKPDTESVNSIKITPNPAKDYVEVECSDNFTFQLTDVYGRNCLIGNKQCENGRATKIDLSSVKTGIYYLKIENEKDKLAGKLVIIK